MNAPMDPVDALAEDARRSIALLEWLVAHTAELDEAGALEELADARITLAGLRRALEWVTVACDGALVGVSLPA